MTISLAPTSSSCGDGVPVRFLMLANWRSVRSRMRIDPVSDIAGIIQFVILPYAEITVSDTQKGMVQIDTVHIRRHILIIRIWFDDLFFHKIDNRSLDPVFSLKPA